jgi:hypothetical protein
MRAGGFGGEGGIRTRGGGLSPRTHLAGEPNRPLWHLPSLASIWRANSTIYRGLVQHGFIRNELMCNLNASQLPDPDWEDSSGYTDRACQVLLDKPRDCRLDRW